MLRNIGIAAHIDAGKTTLTERILYYSGKIHKIGETHTGSSQMDTGKEERRRGITISAAATQTQWQRNGNTYTINIIDTPGHVDFTIEVERALRVLDGMVALFDAVAGVEPQSETVWRQADRYAVPRLAFVNKMDRMGADFDRVVWQISERLRANALPLQIPIGEEEGFVGVVDLLEMEAWIWDGTADTPAQRSPIPSDLLETAQRRRGQLLETLALLDEALLEQYLDDPTRIATGDLRRVIRQATLAGELVPVLAGAAYKNKGVQPLLDAVVDYLPNPVERPAALGRHPETEEEIQLPPTEDTPFAALVFKVLLDERNRKLSFIRVYSGSLSTGDMARNARTGERHRIGQIYRIHANKRERVERIQAGDIAALASIKGLRTGDTVSDTDLEVVLESLFVPEPVIGMAIEPLRNADSDKLGIALGKLVEEDPTFRVFVDKETGQTIIQGMGELHLDVILRRLETDFGIATTSGAPRVTYREELVETVRHRERLKKFTGGPGLFAEIEVELGPADAEYLQSPAFLEDGKRLQFVDEIVGGAIPKEFIPSVEKGFAAMLDNGVLAGYPLAHVKVRLMDGKTHSTESKPLAFELVAKEAFRTVAPLAQPRLLEPVMRAEVTVPEDYLGKVIGDLNRRRAMIRGQENRDGIITLQADCPLAGMFGYVGDLRAFSSGRGNFSMVFSHYAPVPTAVARDIIAEDANVI